MSCDLQHGNKTMGRQNLEVFLPSDNHDIVQITAVLRHDRVAQESKINKSEQKHTL